MTFTKLRAYKMVNLKETLSKYQAYVLGAAILLASIAVSIRSNDGNVHLVLHKYPVLIFLLVVISSFLFVVYIQIDKKEISNLSDQIRAQSTMNGEEMDALLNELTTRQREVYDLIISGKTNKEILAELYIEQSTLKTHINQIYKKLNIKGRNELKSKFKA
ncbi:MAG: LuxR C-terminal-related transcriptional regulator [Bacteroidota bacterium]